VISPTPVTRWRIAATTSASATIWRYTRAGHATVAAVQFLMAHSS
jgi:hypothetical protein